MNMTDDELEQLAHDAYLDLLSIPYGSVARLKADKAMALLRDIIADLSGESSEIVQSAYEYEAHQSARLLSERSL